MKNLRLLVSCCGKKGGLYIVEGGEVVNIFKSHGTSGIAKCQDMWYILSGNGIVNIMDAQCSNFVGHFRLPGEMPDFHDVAAFGKRLFFTATHLDSIDVYDVTAEDYRLVGTFRMSLSGYDSCHINGIFPHKNGIVITMFSMSGKGNPDKLAETFDGGAVFVPWPLEKAIEGTPIVWNVPHIHSPFIYDNRLYICSSIEGCVYCVCNDMSNPSKVLEVDGYARGLYIDDEYVICGASSSKAHPSHLPEHRDKTAAVYVYDKGKGSTEIWEIPGQTEVFQVRRLDVLPTT